MRNDPLANNKAMIGNKTRLAFPRKRLPKKAIVIKRIIMRVNKKSSLSISIPYPAYLASKERFAATVLARNIRKMADCAPASKAFCLRNEEIENQSENPKGMPMARIPANNSDIGHSALSKRRGTKKQFAIKRKYRRTRRSRVALSHCGNWIHLR